LAGLVWLFAVHVEAAQLRALARLEPDASSVTARASGDIDVHLKITQAVPFRAFTLASPARLVLDFREVNFDGAKASDLIQTPQITSMRRGLFQPGWSRMVLGLASPMRIFQATMKTDPVNGDALVHIRLTAQDAATFTAQAGARTDDLWRLPKQIVLPPAKHRPMGDRKTVVALDPGHGGIDPGAEYQGFSEAGLVLKLARELKEQLIRSGRYEVFLTRDEDVFLSLEDRVSRARARGADIFISIHADALSEGTASGATVYTLSDTASDKAAALLAKSHERSDLLAGVDLSRQDDLIASVLMDMARVETQPRSEKLADAIVAGIAGAVGKQRARPRLSAGFSVLKAADIPSVLVEFGFMSNPLDLKNLTNTKWRKKVIAGLVSALDEWGVSDAAQARLLRK